MEEMENKSQGQEEMNHPRTVLWYTEALLWPRLQREYRPATVQRHCTAIRRAVAAQVKAEILPPNLEKVFDEYLEGKNVSK